MIDQEKLYWDVFKHGIGKIAKKLGISESTLSRKLKEPTSKFYVDEYLQICQILHPNLKTATAVNKYLT